MSINRKFFDAAGGKMFIRPITLDDVENFYHMMCWLDEETEYMMYEPGERQLKSNNLDDLKGSILILLFFLFRLIEFHDFILYRLYNIYGGGKSSVTLRDSKLNKLCQVIDFLFCKIFFYFIFRTQHI